LAASDDNHRARSRVVTNEAAKAMPFPALGNAQSAFEFRGAAANLRFSTESEERAHEPRSRLSGSLNEQGARA